MFWLMYPLTFIRYFMLKLLAYMELKTKPFIQSTGVDYCISVNHVRVQVLSYSKYSLLIYLLSGLNLQPPDDFT